MKARAWFYSILGAGLCLAIAIHFRPWELADEKALDSRTQPGGLPFDGSRPDALPAAAVPNGAELQLWMVVGSYARGSGMAGASLDIDDEGRWTYCTYGCMDACVSRGRVRIREGRVVLEMKEGRSPRGATSACIPVFWGRRVYLLGAQDLVAFANDVNWGLEPRPKTTGVPFFDAALVRVEGGG